MEFVIVLLFRQNVKKAFYSQIKFVTPWIERDVLIISFIKPEFN